MPVRSMARPGVIIVLPKEIPRGEEAEGVKLAGVWARTAVARKAADRAVEIYMLFVNKRRISRRFNRQ